MENEYYDFYYSVQLFDNEEPTGVSFTFDDLESAEAFVRLCLSNDYQAKIQKEAKER